MHDGVEGRPESRAIITKAFDTDKESKVKIKEIRKLGSLDITDPRWLEAMRAISDRGRDSLLEAVCQLSSPQVSAG